MIRRIVVFESDILKLCLRCSCVLNGEFRFSNHAFIGIIKRFLKDTFWGKLDFLIFGEFCKII